MEPIAFRAVAASPSRTLSRRQRPTGGYTVIELVIAILLAAVLLALIVPSVSDLVRVRKQEEAIADLTVLGHTIERYAGANAGLPEDLRELDAPKLEDPWGQPYIYLPNTTEGYIGRARKDRFLKPINTDFDLYSLGPDGRSRAQLQAPESRDDIVRAANGAFVGVAPEF